MNKKKVSLTENKPKIFKEYEKKIVIFVGRSYKGRNCVRKY